MLHRQLQYLWWAAILSISGLICAAEPVEKTDNPSITGEPAPGTVAINPNDGAKMVYIPAGEFVMGSTDEEIEAELANLPRAYSYILQGEKPQHRVYLDGYWIYQTLVTYVQYNKFCQATGHRVPEYNRIIWQDDYPMTNVNWFDAKAYADWAGVMLPTEAQWEKAARGVDGRRYPWGNDWDNTRAATYKFDWTGKFAYPGSHAVGMYPTGTSPYGVLDMLGDLSQWCSDWYQQNYYANSPEKNPTGPENGLNRVLRGRDYMAVMDFCSCSLRSGDFPNDSQNRNIIPLCVSRDCPPPLLPAQPLVPKKNPPSNPTNTIVEKVNKKDNAAMVYVPAGTFIMGCKPVKDWEERYQSAFACCFSIRLLDL